VVGGLQKRKKKNLGTVGGNGIRRHSPKEVAKKVLFLASGRPKKKDMMDKGRSNFAEGTGTIQRKQKKQEEEKRDSEKKQTIGKGRWGRKKFL